MRVTPKNIRQCLTKAEEKGLSFVQTHFTDGGGVEIRVGRTVSPTTGPCKLGT